MTHVRQALRQLVLRPGLAAAVILMLAVGIGATTAIFSLFYQVLLQPLPVPEPPEPTVNHAALLDVLQAQVLLVVTATATDSPAAGDVRIVGAMA